MRQHSGTFIISVMLTAFLLGACQEKSSEKTAAPGPVEVETVTLKEESVKLEVELPGRTAAYRIAEVRPQVNGIVKKRLFAEGAEVRAGEILYQIDPASYQSKLDSAEAALARAEAVEYSARLKAQRYETLDRTNAVSEMDLVEIDATWKQAIADVAAAKAALNGARINLEYTGVRAPIAGRIGKSMISEGALVTAQQSAPLAVIQQLDPLYVDVSQSSSELLRLKKDLAVGLLEGGKTHSEITLLLEDNSEYEHKGTLEFSDLTVDRSTGTVTLRAIVANPDENLLPGMFVRARVSKGIKPDAILVPAASISRNGKGQAVVMLVNAQSNVESRIIDAGRNIGDKVLVNHGLSAGERLIVAGLQKIKQGIAVKAVEQQDGYSSELALKSQPDNSLPPAE